MSTDKHTCEEVLNFWFEEITPAQWWKKDTEFDELVRQRFEPLLARAAASELFEWRETASGRLAEIIVLDQFSRNIYRDTARAFAADPLALALAQVAVACGADNELDEDQRAFLYMPYMHSESLLVHNVALELFKNNTSSGSYDFEVRHRDIIQQFGRYPHRNAILGRESSPEEIEFLQQPGSSF